MMSSGQVQTHWAKYILRRDRRHHQGVRQLHRGASSYIPYSQDSTSFDAYEVSSPTEKVPDSVKTVSGGTGYNNFDTDSSIMYSYQADDAKDVPAIVTARQVVSRAATSSGSSTIPWTMPAMQSTSR